MVDKPTSPQQAPEPATDMAEVPGSGVVQVARTSPTRTPGFGVRQAVTWMGIGVVIVLQIVMLQRLDTSRDEFDATRAAITGLQVDVRGIDNRLDDLNAQIDGLGAIATGGSSGAGVPSNPVSVGPGALPRFTDPQNDIAVRDGYVLGELTAVEYYDAADTTILPADGKARVWLVWAHWCPYCQQELPELAEWWPANAGRFPNTELVTVTTSMDESRGNPLTPYLDASQFPFPVLVDADLRLATQFGTSAFPFWVVTDGDGRVVFRVAGAVGIDTIEAIFTQVEAIATGA